MPRPPAVTCKDCGSSAVGWWKGRYKHPGAASARCEQCYLAYTRVRYARKIARKSSDFNLGRNENGGVLADFAVIKNSPSKESGAVDR
jgi:hypothetical protein